MEIAVFDAVTASEEERRAWHALDSVINRERGGEDNVRPYAESMARQLHPGARVAYHWVMWDDAREQVVGESRLMWWKTSDDLSVADFDVMVRPDLRRQGLAARLLGPVLEKARMEGRTLLGGESVGGHESGAAFLAWLGAEQRMVSRRSLLRTADVDRELLRSWVGRAPERATGYSLVGWRGPCPDELLGEYVCVKEVMNTAPKEDLQIGDDRFDEALIRELEADAAARSSELWTLCARRDATGELVGITQLALSSWWPQRAFQEDTGVGPAHRDRGLGRWLKATLMLELLDERPDVEVVETWNAGSNAAMLGINVAMGFRPAQEWAVWQVATDAAAERIGEHLMNSRRVPSR